MDKMDKIQAQDFLLNTNMQYFYTTVIKRNLLLKAKELLEKHLKKSKEP